MPTATATPEEPTVELIHALARDGLEKVGHHGPMAATVDSSQESTNKWKFVTHELSLSRQYRRIRFELSIRSSGSLSIDDVQIKPVNNGVSHDAQSAFK